MDFLSAGEILDSGDLEIHDELVPEWKNKAGEPGRIRLVQLTAGEAMEMNSIMARPENERNGMFISLVYCSRNPENDAHLFPLSGTPEEQTAQMNDYIAQLKKKSMRVLNRLQKIALRLNRLREADETHLKNVSSEVAIGDLPTASRVN